MLSRVARVALAALAALVCMVPGQAHADGEFNTISHNVLKHNTSHVYAHAFFDAAVAVGVQELCFNNDLAFYMHNIGYKSGYWQTRSSDKACNHGSEYTVAFNKGAFPAVDGLERWGYPEQSGGFNQGFVCIKGSYILRSWWSCSTHLASDNDNIAYNQSNYYRAFLWTRPIFDGATIVAAGDFNLKPNQLHVYWKNFWNMDDESSGPNYQTTLPGEGKVDYTWTDTYNASTRPNGAFPSSGVALVVQGTGSDHHLVRGTFEWS